MLNRDTALTIDLPLSPKDFLKAGKKYVHRFTLDLKQK